MRGPSFIQLDVVVLVAIFGCALFEPVPSGPDAIVGPLIVLGSIGLDFFESNLVLPWVLHVCIRN